MTILIKDIGQLVTPVGSGPSEGSKMRELRVREGCDLLIDNGRIARLADKIDETLADRIVDASGKVVLPGFVDPHTHALFADTREDEFLKRMEGVPYDGGGILASARSVAKATLEQLIDTGSTYLQRILASGTTTIEMKSGYGLDVENETKLLVAIRELGKATPLRVVPTFLGAHTFPETMPRDDYISTIITEMIPAVRRRRLAQFCDVFCDQGFYTVAETRTILRAARGAGLKLKLHADELADTGGAILAAELEATSADHLIKVSLEGMKRLKEAQVIPVLLPGTAFVLGSCYAPAREMIQLGLPIALASDFNPGSCPIYSMFTIIGLAVMRMGLSIEEAITAATLNAACALELSEDVGSLEEGKAADLIVLDLESYRQIPYFFAHNPVNLVIQGGEVVHEQMR